MPAVKKVASASAVAGKYKFIPRELETLCVPISSLQLDPNNPRRNDMAAEKLVELIRQHGFRIPITYDDSGMIRAGNTRFKAATILGMTHVPAIRQKFLSNAAATAFAIADNKASEWAEWDYDALQGLLSAEEIARGSGFTERERQLMSLDSDIEKIKDIEPDPSGMKAKTIVIVSDASQRDTVKEMLKKWVGSMGLDGKVEVK